MQLLSLKLNIRLLDDSALMESLAVKEVEDATVFDNIFDDLAQLEAEEQAVLAQCARGDMQASMELACDDSIVTQDAMDEHEEEIDLFSD
jgi:hypothetical protein